MLRSDAGRSLLIEAGTHTTGIVTSSSEPLGAEIAGPATDHQEPVDTVGGELGGDARHVVRAGDEAVRPQLGAWSGDPAADAHPLQRLDPAVEQAAEPVGHGRAPCAPDPSPPAGRRGRPCSSQGRDRRRAARRSAARARPGARWRGRACTIVRSSRYESMKLPPRIAIAASNCRSAMRPATERVRRHGFRQRTSTSRDARGCRRPAAPRPATRAADGPRRSRARCRGSGRTRSASRRAGRGRGSSTRASSPRRSSSTALT